MGQATAEHRIQEIIDHIEAKLPTLESCSNMNKIRDDLQNRERVRTLPTTRGNAVSCLGGSAIGARLGFLFGGGLPGSIIGGLAGCPIGIALKSPALNIVNTIDRLWTETIPLSAQEYRCEQEQTAFAVKSFETATQSSVSSPRSSTLQDPASLFALHQRGIKLFVSTSSDSQATSKKESLVAAAKADFLLQATSEAFARHVGIPHQYAVTGENPEWVRQQIRPFGRLPFLSFAAFELTYSNHPLQASSGRDEFDGKVGSHGGVFGIVPYDTESNAIGPMISIGGVLFHIEKEREDIPLFLRMLSARPQRLHWAGMTASGEKLFLTKDTDSVIHMYSIVAGKFTELEILKSTSAGRSVQHAFVPRGEFSPTQVGSAGLSLTGLQFDPTARNTVFSIELAGKGWIHIPSPEQRPPRAPRLNGESLVSLSADLGDNGIVRRESTSAW